MYEHKKKITSIANYFLLSFFNFSEYPFTASKTSIGIGKKIVKYTFFLAEFILL